MTGKARKSDDRNKQTIGGIICAVGIQPKVPCEYDEFRLLRMLQDKDD